MITGTVSELSSFGSLSRCSFHCRPKFFRLSLVRSLSSFAHPVRCASPPNVSHSDARAATATARSPPITIERRALAFDLILFAEFVIWIIKLSQAPVAPLRSPARLYPRQTYLLQIARRSLSDRFPVRSKNRSTARSAARRASPGYPCSPHSRAH